SHVGCPDVFMQLHLESHRKLVDRKSTRLNSSHANISYAVFCLKKKKTNQRQACLLQGNKTQQGTSVSRSLDLSVGEPALPFAALFCFFFNDTATTEIYTLSLHDALPIYPPTSNPACLTAWRRRCSTASTA